MDFDPYSHELLADPYPVYAELREKYPVHYNPTHDFWPVAGYDDVLEAIHQPQVFSSGRGISLEIRGEADQSPMPMMIVMDPPRHGTPRVRNRKVRMSVRMWEPSTSASVMMMILP